MGTQISGLLVDHDADHFRWLESALRMLRIKTSRAATCATLPGQRVLLPRP